MSTSGCSKLTSSHKLSKLSLPLPHQSESLQSLLALATVLPRFKKTIAMRFGSLIVFQGQVLCLVKNRPSIYKEKSSPARRVRTSKPNFAGFGTAATPCLSLPSLLIRIHCSCGWTPPHNPSSKGTQILKPCVSKMAFFCPQLVSGQGQNSRVATQGLSGARSYLTLLSFPRVHSSTGRCSQMHVTQSILAKI